MKFTLAAAIFGWGIGLSVCGADAGDLLVSSRFSNNVLRYDRQSGAFKGVFASGNGLANPNGIAYGPDGNLYVGLGDTGRIMKFQGQTGAYLGNFVNSNVAGFSGCRGMVFGPDGHLYVAGANINSVLRFDGANGAFKDVFASGNGMVGTVGLTFASNGDLYVGAALSNAAYRFNSSGQFIRTYGGGSLSNVTGVLLDSQNRLITAYSVSNRIQRYNLNGTTAGSFGVTGFLNTPIGMILDPDGNLLVGSFGTDSVLKYNATTGAFIGTLISSGSGGLDGTHNFAFVQVPGPSPIATALFAGLGTFSRRRRVSCQ
ncbi:MAG: NHL repeat-containing protein [Phycisphaerales bacterium]|nr:NHL repeat-containing protein [Phycisphaerales bacterium]